VNELSIGDERSFRHVSLYGDLKEILRRDGYVFRVLPEASAGRWDRALLLNLTYWGAAGGDVLEDDHVAADVVAHAAWHHLAARAVGTEPGASLSAEALFLGESIASAFDVYLVGRLIGRAPTSSFLRTQVSAMAEAASNAGLSKRAFESLLQGIARDPEGSFARLRELLWDATLALVTCNGAAEAHAALERFDTHPFGSLILHYELSNWVLYARAYAHGTRRPDRRTLAVESALRGDASPLAWLTSNWVGPALAGNFGELNRKTGRPEG